MGVLMLPSRGRGRGGVLVALLLMCTLGMLGAFRGDHDLPGWQGETYQGPSLRGGNLHKERDEKRWIEHLSWSPRAYLYHNFLSKDECEHLIHMAPFDDPVVARVHAEQAAPKMRKSTVVDNASGKSVDSRIRTSSGTFLRRGQDAVIRKVEERIAQFSMIPVENGEGFQILHYEKGQKYEAHYDYFHDQVNVRNGGQRVATMLMYLSDVEDGGETVFPSAPASAKGVAEKSACGRKGLSVKPRRGDALLFWSLNTEGKQDPKSLHAGCPVVTGDKWSATKWMRVGKYDI